MSNIGVLESVCGEDLPHTSTVEITGDSNMLDSKLFEDIESAVPPQGREGREAGDETRNRRFKLCEVARKGAWYRDDDILKQFEVDDILAKISLKGNTALHIAAAAACSEFGIKLLELEQINYGEYLLEKNDAGNTAFWVAAASGNVELARKMLDKNSDLASIRGREDLPYKGREDLPYKSREDKLPLYMAALTGHREMVKFLYEPTKAHLRSEDLIELLVTLMEGGLFDVAVKLVKDHPQIATASDQNRAIWETIFKSISESKIYKEASKAFEELVELLLEEVMRLVDSKISLEIIRKPMFAAADQGNEKFLKIILRKYPDLIFEVDENNYSLVHFAVMNRHINIFRLIDENCSSKDLLTKNKDKKGNTILHLAASLPPPARLTTVNGVIRQLWMEFQWFEVVKQILHPTLLEARNNEGETAEDIFTEQHKVMMSNAEKWTKGTSDSMLMTATIITTITFAAIFQLPGGTDQKRGTSNLAGDPSLIAFVLFDSISLILSSLTIFIFLNISQSKIQVNNYDPLLPFLLLMGFAIFFGSVVTMFEAFCIAILILLDQWMALVFLGTVCYFALIGLFYIRREALYLLNMLMSTDRIRNAGLRFSIWKGKIKRGKQ